MSGAYGIAHSFSSLRPETMRRLVKTHKIFIETGSNVGAGIQVALDAGFEVIHSVEGLAHFYDVCVQRFWNDKRVNLYNGESPQMLKDLLVHLDKRAVIFLDAHSVESNPLLDELKAIWETQRLRHTILIDDVRMFDTPDWHWIRREQAVDLLREINPRYSISYEDTNHAPADLLVAEER